MKKIRKVAVTLLCLTFLLSLTNLSENRAGAKATKKAMKFLKGTWCTAGNSQAIKVVFTRKTMNFYDCWNKSYTKVYGGKKKGKLIGKSKIISTKKKGKVWTIKIKSKNKVTYYKGFGDGLTCQWKDNGKWEYSFSDSLNRL